jgi:hypothetical protein
MKKKLLLATTCFLSATALAEDINTLPKDTTKVIDIEEVVVIASPKETGKLRELPNAVSLISQKDMQINQITTLKNVSALVPNFFMPDYFRSLYPRNRFTHQHPGSRVIRRQYSLYRQICVRLQFL